MRMAVRNNSRHSGARSCASPESITTAGSMDFGPAPSGASVNDEAEVQASRLISFAHRGWVHFINVQFSNPARRSAPMPAAFSLAVAPIETAPARGEATEAVLGRAEWANGTIS
jgi:hypothetical protein